MILAVLMALALSRGYHVMPLADVCVKQWTHVQTTGTVTYVRKQADGDWHITLDDGKGALLVLEIIPAIPLMPPKKGQVVTVKGISRYDRQHKWCEIHPVEALTIKEKTL